MLPCDSLMSYLYFKQGYTIGEFQALFGVANNHLSPVFEFKFL